LIGRQTVMLTVDDALALLAHEGVPLRPNFLREKSNWATGYDPNFISDRSFFSMFSDARVVALDVSDFEGAEVIHDLCVELPDKYAAIADFIYNGSCLDNLFDPARAMRSVSKMLRPNGRVMDFEHGTPVPGAFLCYSPEWFFDFFAVNNYADCQTLVCKFKHVFQDWRVHWWRPYHMAADRLCQSYPTWRDDFVTVVIAEKGENSTDDKTPIQGCYRVLQSPTADEPYVERYRAYLRSPRTFGFPRGLNAAPPLTSCLKLPLKEAVRSALAIRRYSVGRSGSVSASR
jgi:SAM-dependent methyltransferase